MTDAASSQGSDILVRSPDGEFRAYLVEPTQPSGLIVIVLQEIFGVNANIRAICDQLAGDGHVAVAPDLYWRQAPHLQLNPGTESGRARAMELMKGLDREQSVADAKAALDAARKQVCATRRSAAIGYCYGGGVAYLLAVRNLVDAGIAYYGTHLQPLLGEAPNLAGELLLHVAAKDHLCPPDAQAAIRRAIEPLGSRARVVIHEGVDHAFARRGGPNFDADAAARADGMTAALLSSTAAQT